MLPARGLSQAQEDRGPGRRCVGSGQLVARDGSDPSKPRVVWPFGTSPLGHGPHTVSPIDYATAPNFDGDAPPWKYAFMTDELGQECGPGMVKSKAYTGRK